MNDDTKYNRSSYFTNVLQMFFENILMLIENVIKLNKQLSCNKRFQQCEAR